MKGLGSLFFNPRSLFTIAIILAPTRLFADTGSHLAPSESVKTTKTEDNVTPVVEGLRKVACEPKELLEYLKDKAIEDERRATEHLQDKIFERFPDRENLSYADSIQMWDMAINGVTTIRENYQTRWDLVRNKLKVETNPMMVAIAGGLDNHVAAVLAEYSRVINNLKSNKADLVKDRNQKILFTGIPCSACNVGYSILSKDLRARKLGRDTKREDKICPAVPSFDGHELTYDDKKYTVGINPDGSLNITEKKEGAKARNLEIPKEIGVVRAVDQYYEDNKELFTKKDYPGKATALANIKKLSDYLDKLEQGNALGLLNILLKELESKKTQNEKFRHTVKRLADFDKSPGLEQLTNYMDALNSDPNRAEERDKLIQSLGIPKDAIIKNSHKNNRFQDGYSVDYTRFNGGPISRNQDVGNELLGFVRANLEGPTKAANDVLLKLTDACFFCDAALWQTLQFGE